jgi:ribosomal protein S12 methylthiotransferase accessory factor
MARGARGVIADTLTPKLRRAYSPYTGIVRSLEECLHLPSEPPLFRVACEVGRGRGLLGSPLDHLAGLGGSGMSRAEAAAAAVGEALERYSLSYVDPSRLRVASAEELGEGAVDPDRFALFASWQYAADGFPFVPFRRTTRVAWVEGWRIRDGAPAWVPAELVFLGETGFDGAAHVGYATSSGAACAATRDEALARGLAEVLERDAFMIVWANRLSLPLLDWSGDERLVELDEATFAATGLSYAAVDLSVFHRVPSVLGVVRAPGLAVGALGVGAGTAPTAESAWWKALSEAFACRAAGTKLALLRPEQRYGPNGQGVVMFEDHIQYYADRQRARATAFLDESAERVPIAEVPPLPGQTRAEHVAAFCESVGRAGSEAYAVDATSPDVLDLGFVVTKVVAPELCPLEVPHAARFLGGRRLYDASAALGFTPDVLRERDVNQEPHPFP